MRSRISLEERFWSKVDKNGPVVRIPLSNCWLWTGAKLPSGYGKIGVGGHSGGWSLAHRVSWEITQSTILTTELVCHVCDNPSCVRGGHLFLGTNKSNTADKIDKGRCNLSKRPILLNSEIAAEIRNIKETTSLSLTKIGSMFGVHRKTVADIVNRRTWK